MWVYWRPRGSRYDVPLPWWLAFPAPNPNAGYVQLVPSPIEVIWAVVVISIYLYLGVAWALSYMGLGITRGIGTIRKRSAFG